MIQLRPAQEQDADCYLSWFNNIGINKWLISFYRTGKYNSLIHSMSLKENDTKMWTIIDNKSSVGIVALSHIDQLDKLAMIWYLIGDKSFEGKGIATKAVNLVLQKGFSDFKLHCIYAYAASENIGSQKVLEKNGFNKAGVLRQCHFIDNVPQNRLIYDILESEIGTYS